jgi:N12 class adenine-specific DNA methylase
MDRIADEQTVSEIMEIGKIFESPTGGFFTRDEYLAGNVKRN